MEARERWGAALAALAVLGAATAAATGPAVVDDAWISWRYAEHLAAGHGLVYNAGEPPVEGYTNLAWTLLLAAAAWLGAAPSPTLYGLGVLSAGCAAPGVAVLARVLGAGTLASLAAGCALALSPHFAVVATNGIESGAWVAAICWGGVAITAGSPARAAIALVGLATVRPEGALVGLVWLAGRAPGARLRLLGGWAAGLVALSSWRFATYGRLVPNTWDAKLSRSLADQVDFNFKYLTPDWPVWAILGVAFALLPLAVGTDVRRRAAWVIAGLLVLLSFRVDMWMPGGRLLQPAHALVLALVAASLGRRAPWLLLGWALVVPLTPWGRHPLVYDTLHTAAPDNAAYRAGQWLAAHAPPDAWLATRDAGVLAAAVGPRVRVAELHPRALTQPHPAGNDATWRSFTPQDPVFVVPTLQRSNTPVSKYASDKDLLRSLGSPYRYLGRVEQHHHRYYDLYVRADVALPEPPPGLILNQAGAKPAAGPRPFPRLP